MELSCNQCKNEIPYCVLSGTHITKDDLYFCPSCDFAMKLSLLIANVNDKITCQMCDFVLPNNNLVPPNDVL